MFLSANSFEIIGNLGKDPETRRLENGTVMASVFVLQNERWKDQQGNYQEHANAFGLTAYGRQAELMAKHLRKGSKVLVKGRMRIQKKDDGGYYHNYIVNDFMPLDSPSGEAATPPPPGV